jgi:replicative DNA helicase
MEIRQASAYLNPLRKILLARTEEPVLPITSLPTLSRKIHGLPPSKMTVVGARTSMGKTAFTMQLMMDLVTLGFPTIYLGFEMKPEEMMERMFCNRYRINNLDLMRGKIQNYEKEYEDFRNWSKNIKLVFTDDFAKDWNELNAFLMDLPIKPKVVVLDFIQAIAHGADHDKKFIDDYIRNFRMMAIRNDFAGVIVSQINRTAPDAKNKEPQLHQLKGSGFLEEHADMVFLLDWRDKTKQDFVINVAKNRSGPTGFIKANYIKEQYRSEEPPQVPTPTQVVKVTTRRSYYETD